MLIEYPGLDKLEYLVQASYRSPLAQKIFCFQYFTQPLKDCTQIYTYDDQKKEVVQLLENPNN